MRRRPGNPDLEGVMGGAGGPPEAPSQFTKQEINQLKDVMILILASMLGSDMDKQIGQALAANQPIDPGLLQHIVDEARRADIPDSYGPLMQKIFSQIK